MAVDLNRWTRKVWQTLSSIKTGVVLLITVVVLSAAGTIVLQRPVTEADEMQRAYSPQVLRLLDAVGLTDVFHAWWFVTLMLLVSASIIAASIERFPNAWRFYSRPYKYPDQNFRRSVGIQKQFSIPDEETGLVAAERALHDLGFKPERVVQKDHFSLFAERNPMAQFPFVNCLRGPKNPEHRHPIHQGVTNRGFDFDDCVRGFGQVHQTA